MIEIYFPDEMKNLFRLSLLLIFSVFTTLLSGQNNLDSEGNKTGYWIVKYPNGKTRYESLFISGKPVGLMKRYDENGTLVAEMMFDTLRNECFTKLYHERAKLAAEGYYKDQKKDSVWTYYSDQGDYAVLQEHYKEGVLNGIARSYYPGGQVSQQITWKENKKDGPWILYFENGGIRSKGLYIDNSREGAYSTYYPDGTLQLEGQYHNNVADGNWNLYNEDGSLDFTFKYRDGELLNQSELLEGSDEILKKLQDIPEPENIDKY